MYGNRVGWYLSAAIIFIELLALVFVYRADAPSDPTSFGLKAPTYSVNLPSAPSAIVSYGGGSSDAGGLYREALAACRSEKDKLRALGGDASPVPDLEFVKLCKQARGGSGRIFADPAKAMGYDRENEPPEEYRELGNSVYAVGYAYQRRKDPEKAKEVFEAMFALGARHFEERTTYPQLETGLAIMNGAVTGLMALAKEQNDAARREALANFLSGNIEYATRQINPLAAKIYRHTDPHVGDMIAVARNAPDKVWRVEAILALGRCQHTSSYGNDQRGAVKFIRRLLSDSDPVIAAAAKTAVNCTVQHIRAMGR